MEKLDYWRLCDELSVIQAALLIVGEDPSSNLGYVEDWDLHERPEGYEAAKTAISNALRSGAIKGKVIRLYEQDINVHTGEFIDDSVNLSESRVDVDSLRNWLAGRGFHAGFFFPNSSDAPDYLDPADPSYTPKLAAAIRAWQAVTTDPKYLDNGKTVKQNLESWLTAHAAEFDLVKSDGEINADAIKNQIAKVANWMDKGGAPKTPGG
ncbi:MAG: hypothetical protein QF745_11185 [Planctomycetota bacterium]|jgi:hypothetical protein|nr:hypothetical protein [Planctomycetota bacterium]